MTFLRFARLPQETPAPHPKPGHTTSRRTKSCARLLPKADHSSTKPQPANLAEKPAKPPPTLPLPVSPHPTQPEQQRHPTKSLAPAFPPSKSSAPSLQTQIHQTPHHR